MEAVKGVLTQKNSVDCGCMFINILRHLCPIDKLIYVVLRIGLKNEQISE